MVSVIGRKDLLQLSGQTPNDWMGTIGGVDVRQRGPAGVQADIGIRGGSFDQSLVLLNGMKLSDPQTGHHMLNLPLTNEAIEQIEVIKSSASRLYGIGALTGAVNIVTKVPDRNLVYARQYAGDFGLYGMQAGIALHTSGLAQHLSVSKSHSDGYVRNRNSDFDIHQAFYQATYTRNNNILDVTGGFTARAFGAPGFYVVNSTEYEKTQTGFGGISFKHKGKQLSYKAQGYYRYNQDDYTFLRANPTFFQNHHYSHVAGAELHATYQSSFGETGAGIDTRTERLNSNNLGKRERNIAGLFLEHRFTLFQQKLKLTPGMYATAYQDENGSNTAVFPGVDASYSANKNLLFFGSIDKGMRLPTYTDLYYKGPSNLGNADLKAEEALSSELGAKWYHSKGSISVSGFHRYSSNLIDWTRPDATSKWQPRNLNEVTFTGSEFEWVQQVNRLIPQFSVNYTYIDASFNQPEGYTSRYTLSNLQHQLIGKVWVNWFKHLSQTFTIRHVDRVGLANYTLLDSKLTLAFRNWSIYGDVSNILNTKYVESGFVTMPGRWFRVGVDLTLPY